MVLVIGHKFKLEVWENIVKLMAVGEVASFRVKKEVRISFFNLSLFPCYRTYLKAYLLNICIFSFQLVFSYPFVSKTLRDLGKDQSKLKHSCTMTLQTEGIGYSDLDQLMREPCDLEFIIGKDIHYYVDDRYLHKKSRKVNIELLDFIFIFFHDFLSQIIYSKIIIL